MRGSANQRGHRHPEDRSQSRQLAEFEVAIPGLDCAQDVHGQGGADRELVDAPPGLIAQRTDPSSYLVHRGGGCLVERVHVCRR